MSFGAVHIFLGVLLISLVGQGALWRVNSFLDEEAWLKRVDQLETDLRQGDLEPDNPVYSGHPGMAVVWLAAAAKQFGADSLGALRGAVALIVSVLAGGIAAAAFRLMPDGPWWIAAAAVAAFHPLYAQASPTNAVIGPVILLTLLLAALVAQTAPAKQPWLIAALGIVIGLGLATRIPETPLLAGPIVVWLAFSIGWRRVVLVSITALAAMLLFDPLWWQDPTGHIQFMLFRSGLNFTDQVAHRLLTVSDFIVFAPFTLLSLGLGAVYVWSGNVKAPVPRPLVLLFFGVTALFAVIFLSVRAQTMRHFFPVMMVWESLLPLFFLSLLKRARFSFVPQSRRPSYSLAVGRAVVGLIVFSQLFLLAYAPVLLL